MLCDSLDGRGIEGRTDTCICMAKSLHCSPENITILLTGYTPIQNVFGVKKTDRNETFSTLGKKMKMTLAIT